MADYVLELEDGGVIEYCGTNEQGAINDALDYFGEDATIASKWKQDGTNDDGVPNWIKPITCGGEFVGQLTIVSKDKP